MESILLFIQENAQYAHWAIFGLLIIAGLNVPISEDLLIIISGVLASTFVPENTWKLFLAIYFGAYISDWMVYWIGRLWGEKLWKIKWFASLINPERIEQVKCYYANYGISTLIVGRLPFGFRNFLFLSAGLARMNFRKFLIGDGIACLMSNATLFTLSYFCGKNCSTLLKSVHLVIFSVFVVVLVTFLLYRKARKVKSVE